MHDITEPLRLAVGSHSAGSGKGCAMNVISWENGDRQITDFPSCSDPMLAKITQRVNDTLCTHRGSSDLLCPACSLEVLDLGHRTVGTANLPLTALQMRIVYTKIAIDQAKQVAHLVPERYKTQVTEALEAAQAWVENPCPETRQRCIDAAAAYAADAATAAAYAATAAAYAYAATAAAYAADATAAAYAADAATAAAYAADAADAAVREQGPVARLVLAKRAFDLFEELTGHVPVLVTDEQLAAAYRSMVTTH